MRSEDKSLPRLKSLMMDARRRGGYTALVNDACGDYSGDIVALSVETYTGC